MVSNKSIARLATCLAWITWSSTTSGETMSSQDMDHLHERLDTQFQQIVALQRAWHKEMCMKYELAAVLEDIMKRIDHPSRYDYLQTARSALAKMRQAVE